MNFLGVDTSGEYLSVIACKENNYVTRFSKDCARSQSVRLMDEIDAALSSLQLKPTECDFFAVVTGPGSFTGIRIGISTIKGLCLATGKRALAVTSFDVLAYAERDEKLLPVIDAGHGYVYLAGYENRKIVIPPQYCSLSQAEEYSKSGYRRIDCHTANPCKGFLDAVKANYDRASEVNSLSALYLRKSSAEENLKKQGLFQ